MGFHASGNPLVFAGIALVMSLIYLGPVILGPWKRLTSVYKFDGLFRGGKIKIFEGLQGIPDDLYIFSDGCQQVNSRLNVQSGAQGLYLKRFGYPAFICPAVLIPWGDIRAEEYRLPMLNISVLASKFLKISSNNNTPVVLHFVKAPEITLQIPMFIIEKIKTASEGQWKVDLEKIINEDNNGSV